MCPKGTCLSQSVACFFLLSLFLQGLLGCSAHVGSRLRPCLHSKGVGGHSYGYYLLTAGALTMQGSNHHMLGFPLRVFRGAPCPVVSKATKRSHHLLAVCSETYPRTLPFAQASAPSRVASCAHLQICRTRSWSSHASHCWRTASQPTQAL